MTSHKEEEAIRTTVDKLLNDSVTFLEDLIRADTSNPPGNYEEIESLLRNRYDDLGWDTEVIIPPTSLVEKHDLSEPRPNVLAYAHEGSGTSIALVAHSDTVPVTPSEWTTDPFEPVIRDGRLYGRGTKDCKGRIAAYTLAAHALDEADLWPEDVTLIVASTVDEEIGSACGAEYLVNTGHLVPDYAIVEGNIDEIWNAGAGVLQFEVTVEGVASHAGLAPEEGANAILSAVRILDSLEEYIEHLEDQSSDIPGFKGPTCVPGTIEGGVKSSVVPSECTFSVDMRTPPDFSLESLESEFRERIEKVTLVDGTSVKVDCTRRIPSYQFDSDQSYLNTIQHHGERVRGHPIQVHGISGTTDARHFVNTGTKCVNYGPGDGQSNSHGADESISIAQIRDSAEALAASVIDIANSE